MIKRIIEEGSSKRINRKKAIVLLILLIHTRVQNTAKKGRRKRIKKEFYNDITDYDSERAHEIDRRVFQEMHHKEPGEMLDQMKKTKNIY